MSARDVTARAVRKLRRDSMFMYVFFCQAEDGIRDIGVTGVQTCALPIFVARVVAERVVDLLEVVDVEQHERSAAAVAGGALELALERLVEVAPVVQAGERVAHGLLAARAEVARVLKRDRELLDEQAQQREL